MRFAILLVAMAAAMALTGGCEKALSAKDLEGAWTGKMVISDAELLKQLKAVGQSEKELPAVKKQLEDNPIPLELKTGMSYTMGAGRGQTEGTWTFEKSKLTLTIKKAGGMNVEEFLKQAPQFKDQFQPMVFTVDKEGKAMNGTIPGPTPFQIAFTRKPAK